MDAVLNNGTRWDAIMKEIKYPRTLNSITKRWHGKLKFEKRGKEIVKVLVER